MPMSFDGHAASSSGCAIKPRARGTGLAAFVVRTGISLRTGCYAMATAEHREPCDSRGSCTVLGAPGGAIPLGDSTWADKLYPGQQRTRARVSSAIAAVCHVRKRLDPAVRSD